MKFITVIGARPQIIKAAALSRAVSQRSDVQEIIVHTGQHYDANMSAVFFKELGIPEPDYNLGVGSGLHGIQTAKMLSGVEEILLQEKPDFLVVYGDTNSTLAAALAAAKVHIPVAHIEAGLRSFNKKMPEEINRICCDHCSTLLFTPTMTGFQNLINEGFKPSNKAPHTIDNPLINLSGDVMYDNSLHFSSIAEKQSSILKDNNISSNFTLCTIHRDSNTDDPQKLTSILQALEMMSETTEIVLPLHPRTTKMINTLDSTFVERFKKNPKIKILPPASFLDMIMLERHCSLVVTDSGGVQKEAYFFEKPCIILREETEWVEIVQQGTAILCGDDKHKILDAFNTLKDKNLVFPKIFGDGHAAEKILQMMLS